MKPRNLAACHPVEERIWVEDEKQVLPERLIRQEALSGMVYP